MDYERGVFSRDPGAPSALGADYAINEALSPDIYASVAAKMAADIRHRGGADCDASNYDPSPKGHLKRMAERLKSEAQQHTAAAMRCLEQAKAAVRSAAEFDEAANRL